MINLIPNQDKKKMNRDFYFRLVAVSFAMLAFSLLVMATAMLPAYFASSLRYNVAETKLAEQKKEVVPELDKQTLATIQSLNKKLLIIEGAEQNKFAVSQKIIQEVISKKTSDIRITQISYQNDAIKGKVVNVLGVAPSRDRLLLFRKALEDDSNFKSVDLPISNFLKGTNIEFNLVLVAS